MATIIWILTCVFFGALMLGLLSEILNELKFGWGEYIEPRLRLRRIKRLSRK